MSSFSLPVHLPVQRFRKMPKTNLQKTQQTWDYKKYIFSRSLKKDENDQKPLKLKSHIMEGKREQKN